MQLNYRTRMILYNMTLYIGSFIFIYFLVLQGFWYISIDNKVNETQETVQDAQLAMVETLKLYNKPLEVAQEDFNQNYRLYYNRLNRFVGQRFLLYNSEGHFLLDSYNSNDRPYVNDEMALSMDNQSQVMTVRTHNKKTQLFYAAPLKIDTTTIGYIVTIDHLNITDTLVKSFTLLYAFGGIIGFIALFVVILNFTNHMISPLKELTELSGKIADGHYDVTIQYFKNDEIGDLTQVYNNMTKNINMSVRQLDSERKRLASLLAALDDGVLGLDKDGRVISYNSYIRTYFNVNNPKSVYDFQYQSFLRDIYDKLRSGVPHVIEEIEVDNRQLLIIGSPTSGNDLEVNYLILIRNITAHRHLEKEQKKFISSVSHELRTPLTTIIGYTDMLLRRNIEDKAIISKSLNSINKEGHRLLRLVDDLINIHQYDLPEFDINKTNVNIYQLLETVVEHMRVKSSTKEIDILLSGDPNMPMVFGDYDRLQQLFTNIIHNSIKYSDRGDIINVFAALNHEDPNYVTVSVRDYGIGISDNEKSKIFDAFYRVEEDRARSDGEGGAGIGLNLVKEIVDKHNGHIQVDSHEGEGTNMIVNLPVINLEDEEVNHE